MNLTLSLLLPLSLGQPLMPGVPSAAMSSRMGTSPQMGAFPQMGAPGMAGCPAPGMPGCGYAPPGHMSSGALHPGPLVPCPPVAPPAPVLAAKVLLPEGMTVTVYPGTPMAKAIPIGSTVGFRPGYSYRLAISNIPGRPGETLYPVLEIRGSLIPRAKMNYMEFPTPIFISALDVQRALQGALITKAIYLEDPEKATPVQTEPDEPLEFTDTTPEEALAAAKEYGRLVAVMRLGGRWPDAELLKMMAVPNTILLPGEARLASPSLPPNLACNGVALFDPLIGPKPANEECFIDGGDKGPRLGIGPRQQLGGLNVTDVSAEYTILDKRKVTTSNVVCLCIPRFAIRRVETGLGRMELVVAPQGAEQTTGRVVVSSNLPPQAVATRQKPVEVEGAIRPVQQVGREGIHIAVSANRPSAIATSVGTAVAASVVGPEELNLSGPFVVCKAVEPAGPVKIGEEVTFTLTYRNNTRLPIRDVVLSDSLSPRLAYIAGSASSDRPTNVTTSENEAGSLILRFELPGELPPNQGGVVKFRAKVR
ncbi:MAG: DUF11 domain-containing protein [Bacteroidales bacterium]|nr:DUF11 domain-containing protein [Bacteroidales bacterium]